MSTFGFKGLDRRKSQQGGTVWLTIYSDLTTNLMLFFLMLFAITRLSAEEKSRVYNSLRKDFTTIQEKNRFEEVLKVEKKVKDDISELVSQFSGGSGDLLKINVSEQYIKMRLPSPVLFDVGSAELKMDGKAVLDQISEILKPLPHEVVIEGHSDNTPVSISSEYFSNWELSGMRALAAVRYLITRDIDPNNISAISYGSYHPLFPNDTAENRASNRRIEINIVREK